MLGVVGDDTENTHQNEGKPKANEKSSDREWVEIDECNKLETPSFQKENRITKLTKSDA